MKGLAPSLYSLYFLMWLVDQKMVALRYEASRHAFCFTCVRAYKQKKLRLGKSMILILGKFTNVILTVSEATRSSCKLHNFSGGACPQTPLVLACLCTLLHHTLIQKWPDDIQNASSGPVTILNKILVGVAWLPKRSDWLCKHSCRCLVSQV